MFSNKFVMSVLVNNQVQKEFANGEINLPFGSEFIVRLRNKNDRRAVVQLFIDGEKMCRGGFVISGNSHRDIECSSATHRKFKFVDLASTEAQDHGKDHGNAEKKMGVIEAHWFLEKELPVVKEIHHHHHDVPLPYYPLPYYPRPYRRGEWLPCVNYSYSNVLRDGHATCGDAGPEPQNWLGSPKSFEGSAASAQESVAPATSTGATVEGRPSSQRFGEMNLKIEKHATVLRVTLKGFHADAKGMAGTPTGSNYCGGCGGRIVKASSRYCHLCGQKI